MNNFKNRSQNLEKRSNFQRARASPIRCWSWKGERGNSKRNQWKRRRRAGDQEKEGRGKRSGKNFEKAIFSDEWYWKYSRLKYDFMIFSERQYPNSGRSFC